MAYPPRLVHGTDTGYSTHRKRGEEACAECKAAHSKYNSTAAKQARAQKRQLPPESICGTERGYNRHIRLKEKTCQPCRDAHAAENRRKRAENPPPSTRKPKPFRVKIPLALFAELYWTASPKALIMLDDHFGSEKVDELIKRAEDL